MIVGLYDQDLAIYQQLPFNLELMKWSTYYKSQRQIVKLSNEYRPQFYSKFIYEKDIEDGIFEPDLAAYKNLEYGGLAFSHGVYKPLPLEVEACQPDNYVYLPTKQKFNRTTETRAFFKQMLKAQHVRLSLDGKTIWPKYEQQLNFNDNHTVIYSHDLNLAEIDGAIDCLLDLAARLNRQKRRSLVGSKFPIIFTDENKMLKWTNETFQNDLFTIQFNGLLSDAALYELIEARVHNSFYRQFFYVITYGCSSENEFFLDRLPQIYKQVLFLRSHRQKISLKYETNFFSSVDGENTVRLLEAFCNSNFYDEIDMKYDSLYSFAKHMYDTYEKSSTRLIKDDARGVFRLVREKNDDLFKQFYELHQVEYKGGKLYDSV